MKELDIRAASAAVPAETLSGGNQQKVVLGKWLAASPRVLILDEPTRGVDVGAKAEVHRLIRSLAQQGMATLLISSDLPELLAMSDRILVMRAGRLAGELGRAEATPEKVLALALGQAPAGAAAGKVGMTAPTAAGTPRQALALGPMARRLARQREYGVLALLVATVAAVAVVNPAFLSGQNVRDMLVQCAPAAIVACGATLVMVTGEIDISVGSLMALLAATLGLLTSANHAGLPPAVGIIGVLAAGTLVGLTNGVLVALLRVPSIIVTLGMLTALRGVTELLMAGE